MCHGIRAPMIDAPHTFQLNVFPSHTKITMKIPYYDINHALTFWISFVSVVAAMMIILDTGVVSHVELTPIALNSLPLFTVFP